MKHVTSPSNPLLKTVRRLARPRRREARFLLEGRKLVHEALANGVDVESVLVSSRLSPSELQGLEARGIAVVAVSEAAFRRSSTVETPEGLLAVALRPKRTLEELRPRGQVLVAVGIQDPGNLGALARVAEAAGAAALAVVRGSADPFGPKAMRGSMGSLLRLPVFEIEDAAVLRGLGFRRAALVPRGGVDFRRADFRPPLAILIGGESTGLPEAVLSGAELRVTIPMRGRVESLNVATAAALVLYEATRKLPG